MLQNYETNYTYNIMMRLTAKTVASITTDFSYDSNGNLTEKEESNSSYEYIWDINNRLRDLFLSYYSLRTELTCDL